jgi:hypothetical protein
MLRHEVCVISPKRERGDIIKTAIHAVSQDDWELIKRGKPITYSESLGHPFTIVDEFGWDNVEETVKKCDALILPCGRAPEYLSLLPEVRKLVY